MIWKRDHDVPTPIKLRMTLEHLNYNAFFQLLGALHFNRIKLTSYDLGKSVALVWSSDSPFIWQSFSRFDN